MPFGVKSSKGRVLACSEKMALGVLLMVPKFVAEMASVCTVVASCGGVGSVDGFSTNSGPESSKA